MKSNTIELNGHDTIVDEAVLLAAGHAVFIGGHEVCVGLELGATIHIDGVVIGVEDLESILANGKRAISVAIDEGQRHIHDKMERRPTLHAVPPNADSQAEEEEAEE
jgi:hypothetical protein